MKRTQGLRSFATLCAALFLFVWLAGPALALEPRQYAVEVTAEVKTSPPEVRLRWPLDASAGDYDVFRKSKDAPTWGAPIARLSGRATGYVDTAVTPLNAYEYQIIQYKNFHPYPAGNPSDWLMAHGYIYVGIDAPFNADRGKVWLVVDSAVAGDLELELARLKSDLSGDGWTVGTILVHRSESVPSVKERILTAAASDPATRALFLIGHVPVPYSGDIYPDLHITHRGAWPADGYYGDLNGNWTDGVVWRTDTEYLHNENIHGDGKFDQSLFPSEVELEVGRVDFHNLNIDGRTEIQLLRQYFLKNHNYRHKKFSLPRQGLIRDNFGETDGDAPAATAWRAFAPMFGSSKIVEVAEGAYFSRLSAEGFLWSFGAGGGTFDHADGVGYTVDFYRQDPKTVFMMLHGSYFGDWDTPNNFLRGALAAPTYTLAAIWAGLPHWFMHHMAIGETLGFSTRLAQNNWDTYKSQVNLSRREVHISLIGDPTLRMGAMAPPANVRGTLANGVTLTWDPSPDASLGYQVYRAPEVGGKFVKINRSPVTQTSYTDASYPGGKQVYMVRAYRLETSFSGTFYNSSQGIIWATDDPAPPPQPVVSIVASDPNAHEEGLDTATLTLSRTGNLSSPLTVTVSFSGSAQNGEDVDAIATSHRFEVGQATLSVTVRPKSDNLAEGEETLGITLTPSSAYAISPPGSATIRIGDKVVPPTIDEVFVGAGGITTLRFRGAVGALVRVESSPDFKVWTHVADVRLDSAGRGQQGIELTGKGRFYRLVVN